MKRMNKSLVILQKILKNKQSDNILKQNQKEMLILQQKGVKMDSSNKANNSNLEIATDMLNDDEPRQEK